MRSATMSPDSGALQTQVEADILFYGVPRDWKEAGLRKWWDQASVQDRKDALELTKAFLLSN